MFEPGCSGLEDGPRLLNNRFEPGGSGFEDGPRILAECLPNKYKSSFVGAYRIRPPHIGKKNN